MMRQILPSFRKVSEIADPVPPLILRNCFESLPPSSLLLEKADLKAYLLYPGSAPRILQEIGRLREITFRAVGEGTGYSTDTDEFDDYFHQLVIWDKKNELIVGAYRIGFGPQIYKERGIKGFYVRSLFKIHRKGHYLLKDGLELGRSFIREEYQMKPMPLFMLWQAILKIVQQENIQYIFGGISISNAFSQTSRSLIAAYIKKYYYDAEYAEHVKAKVEYRAKLHSEAHKALVNALPNDVKSLQRMVRNFEPAGIRFPVLIRQYLSQNARIVGFNIDPKFGNCLDAFMYLNVKHIPDSLLTKAMNELNS